MRHFVFQCLLQQNATVNYTFLWFIQNKHTYQHIHPYKHTFMHSHFSHFHTHFHFHSLFLLWLFFHFILFLMWQKKHLLRAGGRSFDNPYTLKEAPRARKNNTTVPLNVPWKTKTEFFCVCHGCCPFSPLAVW